LVDWGSGRGFRVAIVMFFEEGFMGCEFVVGAEVWGGGAGGFAAALTFFEA